MEKITKQEAIQALSDHYDIPFQIIVEFIKSESKGKKKEYRIQEFLSLSDANEYIERAVLYKHWKPISIAAKGDGGALYVLFEQEKK